LASFNARDRASVDIDRAMMMMMMMMMMM